MAEQIRSFWSHLCGIFGAIFGIIAGGTLVTIEHAVAYSGSADCSRGEGSYTTTVASGAFIEYCYGGGWLCAQKDSGSGYIMNNWSNYPRYYAYFKGCASGYYATKNVASGTELHTVISSVAGMIRTTGTNPYVSGTTSCITHSGCMFNTSTYKAHDSYDSEAFQCDPYEYEGYSESLTELGAKAGCEKCPSYGEYAAMSTSGTATTISNCFMSANTEYSDEVDTGVATGKFIWTSDCYYDDSGSGATTVKPILEQVRNIIAERMDINASSITMNSTLYDDLGMDELDFIDTVYDLENEYGVEIDAEVYENWTTVADIVYWIQENV